MRSAEEGGHPRRGLEQRARPWARHPEILVENIGYLRIPRASAGGGTRTCDAVATPERLPRLPLLR